MQQAYFPFYVYYVVYYQMAWLYLYLSGKLNKTLNFSCNKILYRNKSLRRPRNFFLINLAVTDLGLLLTNNTMHIIASFNKQWPFGQIGKLI